MDDLGNNHIQNSMDGDSMETAREDGVDAVGRQCSRKPTEIVWLTDDLKESLDQHSPSQIVTANDEADEVEMVNAFSSVFRSGSEWQNMYQLHEAVNYLGNMFGFTTRYSGWKIICACAQTHQQVKKKSLADTPNFGFTAPMEASSKTRNRHSISELNCPMHVNCTPLVRHVKGDTFRKQDKIVKITGTSFHHNHPLTKQMLIKAKKASHQYTIRPEVLRKTIELLSSGPVPTLTLRNFLQNQYPPTLKITSVMVCNVRMQVKALQLKYGNNTNNIPSEQISRAFSQKSLETAPEDWDSNPVLAGIYQEAMMEVLAGEGEHTFPLVEIMDKIKQVQRKGYDYRVYRTECGRVTGVMHMVPAMITTFRRYGDICALDVQARRKNNYGWSGCFPSGNNNNNKLQNFCDALTIVECDRFYAFVLQSMCDISGRPIQSIKLIPADGKLSEPLFRSYLPGKRHI
jgi:hypothetical protein